MPSSADLKKRWVAALRSGKYEQGIGRLRYDNTFCCLGVLADVLLKKELKGRAHWDNGTFVIQHEDKPPGMHTAFISPAVSLDDESHDAEHRLIGMNDLGISFSGIADHIEENVTVRVREGLV